MGIFARGSRFGSREQYCVYRKLGEGQFAEVYEYAVKIEKRKEANSVKGEYKALKRLQGCQQVCRIVDSGVHDDRFFIILELLGSNLVEARKLQPTATFDLPELRTIALSTLVAIESVHQAGFVHRDIKPANFALSSTSEWTIIDFGLARQIINDDGTVMPERTAQGFRGSTVYASVAAHAGKDVGRKDDLWSWVYVLAELIDGSLPWRFDRQQQQEQQEQLEREEVAQQQQEIKEETYRKKQHCMSTAADLTTTVPLPEALQLVCDYLCQLSFVDAPDYQYIRACLHRLPEPAGPPPYASLAPAEQASAAGGDAGAQQQQLPPDADAGAAGWQQYQQYGEYQGQYDQWQQYQQYDPAQQQQAGIKRQRDEGPDETAAAAGAEHAPAWKRQHVTQEQEQQQQQQQQQQQGGPELPAHAITVPSQPISIEVGPERVQELLAFVTCFKQGTVSPSSQELLARLRQLGPVEGLASIAAFAELLVGQTEPGSLPFVSRFLEDVAALAAAAAGAAMARHVSLAEGAG